MLRYFLNEFGKWFVGSVLALVLFCVLWVYGGAYDRLKREIAVWVIGQISFEVNKSEKIMQTVSHKCENSELVSASCISIDASGNMQAAVGPVFEDDRSFSCHSYADIPKLVQATAICYKIAEK